MPNDNVYLIQGYSVSFPSGKKPFPSQFAVMSKMLLGLRQGKNCLLESPTGTGKTLALLCSALAWQRQQRLDLADSKEEIEEDEKSSIKSIDTERKGESIIDNVSYRGGQDTNPQVGPSQISRSGPIELDYECEMNTQKTAGLEQTNKDTKGILSDIFSDDDVFEDAKKRRKKTKRISKKRKYRVKEEKCIEGLDNVEGADTVQDCQPDSSGSTQSSTVQRKIQQEEGANMTPSRMEEESDLGDGKDDGKINTSVGVDIKSKASEVVKEKKKKVPRVFFCSRTHSQLGQVVAELRTCETALGQVSVAEVGSDQDPFSMTLLSSRKNACIHKTAMKNDKGVDEACKSLLKENSCAYFRRSKSMAKLLPQVWDVEDIVRLGKENHACPYYAARESLYNADLVFCPYNYLVDPVVRDIMGISLKNSVVIFDEAHNLESAAREAASANLSSWALSDAVTQLKSLSKKGLVLDWAYNRLIPMVEGVRDFLLEAEENLTNSGYEQAHKIYSGEQALGLMHSRAGVTPESLPGLKEALNRIATDDPRADSTGNPDEDHIESTLSSGAVLVVSSLLTVLGFLVSGNSMENVPHYRMVVLKERLRWGQGRGRRKEGQGSMQGGGLRMQTLLCFWCLSAGVCFAKINDLV
ncbi:unnamed protein product, partial [Choristocarpus tenellus]